MVPASRVNIPMRLTTSPIQFIDALVKSFEDRYPIPSIITMETRNITAAVFLLFLRARTIYPACETITPSTMNTTKTSCW